MSDLFVEIFWAWARTQLILAPLGVVVYLLIGPPIRWAQALKDAFDCESDR